ncbi:hypothetical protein PGPR2_02790 [Pseudomonas aeruginosa PGPR2]|nr:hypothetical protein PGPR2_02790 [Pseudomonas aeruginosa PGPR2]
MGLLITEVHLLEMATDQRIDRRCARHVECAVEPREAPQVFIDIVLGDDLPVVVASTQQRSRLSTGVNRAIFRAADRRQDQVRRALPGLPALAVVLPDLPVPADGIDFPGTEAADGLESDHRFAACRRPSAGVDGTPVVLVEAPVDLSIHPAGIGHPVDTGNAAHIAPATDGIVAVGQLLFMDVAGAHAEYLAPSAQKQCLFHWLVHYRGRHDLPGQHVVILASNTPGSAVPLRDIAVRYVLLLDLVGYRGHVRQVLIADDAGDVRENRREFLQHFNLL